MPGTELTLGADFGNMKITNRPSNPAFPSPGGGCSNVGLGNPKWTITEYFVLTGRFFQPNAVSAEVCVLGGLTVTEVLLHTSPVSMSQPATASPGNPERVSVP